MTKRRPYVVAIRWPGERVKVLGFTDKAKAKRYAKQVRKEGAQAFWHEVAEGEMFIPAEGERFPITLFNPGESGAVSVVSPPTAFVPNTLTDFPATWLNPDGSIRLGGFVRFDGATPGSTEFDYVERTTNLTVNALTDATADTFITGNAVSYNGSTRVQIVAFVPGAAITAGDNVIINLYDGGTDLGRLALIGASITSAYGARFLTPTNASHTYSVKAWKTGGTASLNCGAGGPATRLPAFMRITSA